MFDEGDLVRTRSTDGEMLEVGIVVDVDPSEAAPTYYLISVCGRTPDWYHEDEVFSVPQQPVNASTTE